MLLLMDTTAAQEEAVYARILSRVADRSALATQCSGAFHAEVSDALRSVEQATEALAALRELQSAARFLRARRLMASVSSAEVVDACEDVVRFNVRVGEALERAGGGEKQSDEHLETKTDSDCERPHGGNRGSAGGASGTSRKRKLSEVEGREGEAQPKGDENAKDIDNANGDEDANSDEDAKGGEDAKGERNVAKKEVKSVASPRKASSSISDAAGFDPSESPIELSVPDSDNSDSDSDSDAMRSAPQTSCLNSARRLERGPPASRLSRFPALILQLQMYVRDHRRELATSDKAQEFAEAAALAIRVGMKLQFLPPVRLALANLLVTMEKLEQAVDPLPSPLGRDVADLSLYFLKMTKPQADAGEAT